MNQESVRVRFAPSPTGYLHVGGVRTALFNWFFARSKKGKFILRIEDTDKLRSTPEALDDILGSLKWLGLSWDEGPYFQSKRIEIYQQYADKLLQQGKAYQSTQNRNGELEKGNTAGVAGPSGLATVFKSTGEQVVINDIVHGKIEFDTGLIKDFVIIKSDGMPTYNFACVIDDALMKITHVVRGDDHISNTPKQIMVYRALGFAEPVFAHVPMILGPDGSRLSKRHGATSVEEYRRQGYLAPALLNFLSLLGWAPGQDKELLPQEEIIKKFSLERITGKSAVFNIEKLNWMNGVYISQLDDEEMISLCRPFFLAAGITAPLEELKKIVPLFKKRIKLLTEIVTATDYFFKDKTAYEGKAVDKFLTVPGAKDILVRVKEKLAGLNDFTREKIEKVLRDMVDELGIKPRVLMQTLRVAITGRTVSAGIFETIVGMGKERVLKHIDQAIGLAG